MVECEWGYSDCINQDKKCSLCILDGAFYQSQKKKSVGLKKNIKVQSGRMGNAQEVKVYQQTRDSVQGTPNSGAGSVKGDLEIDNLAMIECKTTTEKNKGRQPGKESFSLQRSHLEKLKAEAAGKKEFHYLVFSFKEHDEEQYAVTDLETLNSMIATMKSDRATSRDVNNQIDVHKKRSIMIGAENTKLLSEIDYLKSILKKENLLDKYDI